MGKKRHNLNLMHRNIRFSLLILLLVCSGKLYSQTSKFNIQTTFPSDLTICGKTDSLVYEIRNISSSGISNIFLTLTLPKGCYYKAASFKGSGVTESNIGNLNAPVFKLSNFTLAGYLRFSVIISSTCDLQTFISKGNQATTLLEFKYTGGSESHVTAPINVLIPNILMSAFTNQIVNAYLKDKLIRTISLKNTGKGGAANFTFYRTNGNGLKVGSSRKKDTYSIDSIISKLDSSDFKLVGNKDIYLDANEEVNITDTVTVIKCNNLTSIYNVKFGCGNTLCNISSKNAIVNLDPFIQGLTIIPSTNIDWCFDLNKPSTNQIILINKSNKPISNTILNITQSYSGGFYNYQMSALDTAGMKITKGKRGAVLTKNFTNFRYNFVGGYFSCLGTSPIGGFSLGFANLAVNDTIYISWKAVACIPNICNTTLVAHRWTYSATYSDPCGSSFSVAENWGSGGGIQYLTAIPWIPADLVSGSPDILNYTMSGVSLFPGTKKSRFIVKLSLENGIKHSLKANDIKFTDINGTDWKPYAVNLNSADIVAYFSEPTINITKSELNIVIEADCKAYSSSGSRNYTVSILYTPDSACTNGSDFQLYCTSGDIKVHCAPSCNNGGMLFKAFSVKRKNYGKPDNNNDGQPDGSGTINLSKIKRNRCMVYDTMSTFYSGMVVASGTTTTFFNGRIKTSVLNGNLLKPLTAIISIYRNGKIRYTCNKLPVSTYLSGTTRFCEIDLNSNAARTAGCGTMTNYFFLQSDSVVVNLNYVYATSFGSNSGEAYFNNPEFYLSTTPNPNSSQKLQCDTFSGRHILLGSYFTNWYTENYTASSCSPVTLYNSYYFSAGNCCDNYAGGNPFPYEYRNFNYLEKIKVSLPKGYNFSSAAIYYYGSAGTNNYTSNYAANLKPIIQNTDTLIFNMDTLFNLTKGIFKRSDEGYQGTLVLNLIPNCQAAINMSEAVTYTSYFKWPDAGVTDVNTAYPDYIAFNHPTVLLTAINSISVSKKDTFSWDIIMTNTKSGSDISNVWLANTLPQKAKILAIKDLSTGSNLQVKNGIFRAGNLSSTSARSFRIYATSTNCILDSFKMAVGWNCEIYPDSLEVYSCKNLLTYINLILSPQPPLIISTLLEDTARTDVCTNRKFQAIIANVDEDNIYQLKLRVTIPPGTGFVDTGMYYSFPYGSQFAKLSKPVLVTGTTYEWALSDSLKVLKNGLERVSDTTKSRIKVHFFLETNCNITAGAFVSIMPDGKIGCGEPVRKIGYTGRPIKIKGVDNPYFSLITLSPDSINLCTPFIAFKAKIIYLGPTKTLANDSILLSMPIGFEPDTASLTTTRINGKGTVKEINQEMRWLWAIPKGLLPGDSSMLDFKLKITNKAPSCGLEAFTMQSVTKKKAFCVKTNDSCDINVATGSFYKPFKLDRSEPIIRLIKSNSINAGDSGEIVDIAFNVTNNKKAIDTSMSSNFYLVVDKNNNGKFDKSEIVVKKFIKSGGWLNKLTVGFAFKGFVKNTDICRLLIVSDSNNCQCLKNSLPLLNIQLKNAGRDTSFCSNYTVIIGLDSIKNYKYEWLPSDYLSKPKKSKSVYKKANLSLNDITRTYYLKTTRVSGCTSTDTLVFKEKPFINLRKLKDTTSICEGSFAMIGDTAKGGKGILSYNWTPGTGLSSTNRMVVKANPIKSNKYYLSVSDQNGCSIKDSLYLNVARLPSVKIGHIGFCEKKDIKFIDQSNYFGQQKGTTIWRINFNNVTQTDPNFAFDTIGFYFVRLIVSNQFGCIDSNYKYINVYGNPIVSNSKLNGCLGDSVKLTDKTTVARMGIKNITWKFATDSVKGKTVSKVFTKPGNYKFTQTVTSDSGCITSLPDSIFIFDNPKAAFTRTGKCLSDTFKFADISKYNPSDSIAKHQWRIPNAVIDSKKISIKSDTSGAYTISLKVISAKGCSDSIKKTIIVNPLPIVVFNVKNGCSYDSIKLLNSSNIVKGKIKSYDWKINSSYSSKATNPIVGLLKEGFYTVNLKVISDSLCSDSLQKSFTIYPAITPKTSFIQGCENETMTFSDISKQGNTRIVTREWKIGSTLYTDSTFLLALNAKGIYPYTLTFKTLEGCNYTFDSTYEVFEKPIADFIHISKCNDDEVSFSDKSIPGGSSSIVSRSWFNNNVLFNTGSNFSNKFPLPGTQSISLEVLNGFGCKDSVNIPVITSKSNYADFTFNNACPGDIVTVNFTGYTGLNAISKYDLRWGDGKQSLALPATHIYDKTNNYLINLTITTWAGCDYDTFKTVTIFPVPQAGFDFYPKYPDVKYPTITISDKSKGASKWYYNFGDTASSKKQNPMYSFKDSGSFKIAQIVENQFGCIDTAYLRVYVNYILLTFIPNAFSPGNDDINPLFQPSGLGIKDFRITIFNRWGEKLFDPDWGKKAWNGIYQNEIVPIGIYPYYIQIIDFGDVKHNYNGVVHVIR